MRLPPWLWNLLASRKTRIALACSPFVFCLLVLLFYYGTHWWGRSQAEKLLRDYEAGGHIVDPEKYWHPAANSQDDLFQDLLFQQEWKDHALVRLIPGDTKMPSLAERLPAMEPRLARLTDLANWVNPPAPDDRTAAELLLKEHRAAVERLEELRPVLARSKEAVWPVGELDGRASVAGPMMRLKYSGDAAGEIAVFHLATGNGDRAAGAVQAMFDVVRLELEPKPAPLSITAADGALYKTQQVIWEGMMRGGWNDGQLEAFDRSLAALRPQQAAVKSYFGEIALLRSQTKWFLGSTRVFPKIDIHRPRGWDPAELWERTKDSSRQFQSPGLELASGVKAQREFMEGAALSGGAPRERYSPQDLAEFRRMEAGWDPHSPYLADGAQPLGFLATATLRMESVIAITRTGIALERYRLQAGNVVYPASLEALVPRFLPEVPSDPFAAGTLRYQLRPDGSPHVWSVGGNFTDDGGLPHGDFNQGDLIWITRPIPGFTERDLRR